MQWGAGHFKRTSSQRASFQGEAVSAERSCSVPSDTKAEGTNCSGGHIRVWLEEGLPPTLSETQPDNPMENLRGVRQVPHRKASFQHPLTPENTYSRPQLDTLRPHLPLFYSTRPLLLLQPGARQLINVKKVLLTQCPMMGSSPWVPAHHHFN